MGREESCKMHLNIVYAKVVTISSSTLSSLEFPLYNYVL
jgi:hypothetical protein